MSTPDNRGSPVLTLLHSSLRKFDDGLFKSECPVCESGVLTVRRHHRTLAITAFDHCVSCGQAVRYLDDTIGGETVVWTGGQRDLSSVLVHVRKVLTEGLKYHEHDGHTLPKKVVRDVLAALGVPEKDQP